jgi:sugar lactone lactonase YvrE
VTMTELFASVIQMGESPRWHDGRSWMCDWVAGEVLAFDGGVGPTGRRGERRATVRHWCAVTMTATTREALRHSETARPGVASTNQRSLKWAESSS